jgi:hypothetical protein
VCLKGDSKLGRRRGRLSWRGRGCSEGMRWKWDAICDYFWDAYTAGVMVWEFVDEFWGYRGVCYNGRSSSDVKERIFHIEYLGNGGLELQSMRTSPNVDSCSLCRKNLQYAIPETFDIPA